MKQELVLPLAKVEESRQIDQLKNRRLAWSQYWGRSVSNMKLDDLKLILVPTDFFEASEVALSTAVTLAQTFHAAIEILHVDLNLALVLPPPGDVISMPIGMEGRLMARAAEKVDRIVTEVREKKVVCAGASEMGRTYTSIVEHAIRISAGLIVLGSHGRHGLGRLLLGSVAEKVVQHAPCAVLVVPVAPKI
ncbi:MAG TPA: universal stress protein [Polyangia bacterium]